MAATSGIPVPLGSSTRHQSQYAEYVRAQQQRHHGSGGAAPIDASSPPVAAVLEERLLELDGGVSDRDADIYDPVLVLPDGRRLRGLAALKVRAAIWVTEHVSWSERSWRGALVLVSHLLFCLFLVCWLLSVGVRHLHDDFSDAKPPSDPMKVKEHTCAQLPLFLIVAGTMGLLAFAIAATLVGLAARGAQARLEIVAFPCLTSLTLLGGAYTIWFIVGQVWTFSATVGRTPDTGAECPEQLFHAALFAVIATYVLTVVQLCLTCMRRCCQKDILPV